MISIADNGVGIAEQYYEDIFKPFNRVHSRKDLHGHGLGLASCKRVAELHNTKLILESVVGKGSTFSFTLQLAASKNMAIESEEVRA